MRTSGIYCLFCKANEKFYIGQSQNMKSRKANHIVNLKNNNHHNPELQSDWNKYGEESFEFKVLHECPMDMMNHLEDYYIKRFDAITRGYNLQDGNPSIDWNYCQTVPSMRIELFGEDDLDKFIESDLKRVYSVLPELRLPYRFKTCSDYSYRMTIKEIMREFKAEFDIVDVDFVANLIKRADPNAEFYYFTPQKYDNLQDYAIKKHIISLDEVLSIYSEDWDNVDVCIVDNMKFVESNEIYTNFFRHKNIELFIENITNNPKFQGVRNRYFYNNSRFSDDNYHGNKNILKRLLKEQ